MTFTQRQDIVHLIANYIIESLNNSSNSNSITGFATKISTILCNKYPNVFLYQIDNLTWGNGIKTLRQKICNLVGYIKSMKKVKITQAIDNDSSTDEDIDNLVLLEREVEIQISRHQDSHGCIDYAPSFPVTESTVTQENKIAQLEDMFYLDHLLTHGSRHLGKDIAQIWNSSLDIKIKTIRIFFKILKT